MTNKQDLQDERSDYAFIANMSEVILEKLKVGLPSAVKAQAQIKVDEINTLLDLFNDTPTTENIDFVS